MVTYKITVKGLVQGIGYRPFVAELAELCGIRGWVKNTSGIVTILASGEASAVELFLKKLENEAPEGALVEAILREKLPYEAFDKFAIRGSDKREGIAGIPRIPADLPTCEGCLKEMRNPKNRRYRHPFISCTACGPRYSIIEALPYDRETISMKRFEMCGECEAEYRMQGNVRRHAQTIACPKCGPKLRFYEGASQAVAVSGKEDGAFRPAAVSCGAEVNAGEINELCEAEVNVSGIEEFCEAEENTGVTEGFCEMEGTTDVTENFCEGTDALVAAVECLRAGGIVAVKDIGGYHLVETPYLWETAAELRRLKGREKKPFAVMFPDVDTVKEYCVVSGKEEELLLSTARPIVLLRKKELDGKSARYMEEIQSESGAGLVKGNPEEQSELEAGLVKENPEEQVDFGAGSTQEKKEAGGTRRFADNVCGSSPDIGAMLPCNPLQTILVEELGPLIMTSANGSGELLLLDNDKMREWMQEHAGNVRVPLAVLEHDRPILTPLDDSIVRVVCGRTQIFRRARGYVPNPVRIPVKNRIFAAGGDLKSSFCYTVQGEAVMSQHLGDLADESCFAAYRKETARMQKLFGFAPEYVACDLHPGYLSAQEEPATVDVAIRQEGPATVDVPIRQDEPARTDAGIRQEKTVRKQAAIQKMCIQHHEAHVASVIAEHNLQGTVLGFAFDGTGYGRDATIWGSEGFLWDGKTMKRVSHLKPVRLIGGDEGARNADTILYGYMAAFGEETKARMQALGVGKERFQIVEAAIRCGINTVESSSMGRLFDAVSAFLDICHYNGYEGEAAIALENLAIKAETAYPLSIGLKQKEGQWIGDTEELFTGIAEALEKDIKKAEIARGFIYAVADFISNVTEHLIKDAKELQSVAAAGGTFQNRILLERTIGLLEEKGYTVYINEQVPPGDGGICLGQAYLCDVNVREHRM